jgi:hypothetical protein
MRRGIPALAVAAAFFALFLVNVSAGAFAQSSFLGDVGDMLTLMAASVAFVVGVLQRERAERLDEGR